MMLIITDVIGIVIWKQVVVLVVHSFSMCPQSWPSPIRLQLSLSRLKSREKDFTILAYFLAAAPGLQITLALLSTTLYIYKSTILHRIS